MLITERHLRNIIRETLISEVAAAALSDTIRDGDYADPDDISYRYRVVKGKFYYVNRPGVKNATKSPPVLITNAAEIARVKAQILKRNTAAVSANVVTQFVSAMALIPVTALPLAGAFLISFLAMRQKPYAVTTVKYREKMHYVVQAAIKRLGGKKNGVINYDDYQTAQRMDPETKSAPAPTWQKGIAGPAAIVSGNPYTQLSASFGHVFFEQNGDEFLVHDTYEFILDRDPTIVEAAKDYVLGFPAVKAWFSSMGKSGTAAVTNLEAMLVAYEATFGYRGFPTSLITKKPGASAVDTAKAYVNQLNPLATADTEYKI